MQASDLLAQTLKKKAKEAAGAAAVTPAAAAVPTDLTKLFHVGQYVRCTVVGLPGDPTVALPAGKQPAAAAAKGEKAAAVHKSVQLSLRLKRLCGGLGPATLHEGAVVPASVRSAEDHGYTLDLGIKVRHRGAV